MIIMIFRLSILIILLVCCCVGLYLYIPYAIHAQEKCPELWKEVNCYQNQTASDDWNNRCDFGMTMIYLVPVFIFLGLGAIFFAVFVKTFKLTYESGGWGGQ